MFDLLNEEPYMELKKNTFEKSDIAKEKFAWFTLSQLCGLLPEIHENGVPLGSIVRPIYSPTYFP